MSLFAMLKHPNAFRPVAMSLGALATVVIFLAMHGACFLAALVSALSCVRGSASPSRSSVRLTVAPQPRWPERYDSLALAFSGDNKVHASAAHGLRASSIRLDLVPAIVRLDQQGSPHAGSSSVPCGAGGNVRHPGRSLSRSVSSSSGGFTSAKARPHSPQMRRWSVCNMRSLGRGPFRERLVPTSRLAYHVRTQSITRRPHEARRPGASVYERLRLHVTPTNPVSAAPSNTRLAGSGTAASVPFSWNWKAVPPGSEKDSNLEAGGLAELKPLRDESAPNGPSTVPTALTRIVSGTHPRWKLVAVVPPLATTK